MSFPAFFPIHFSLLHLSKEESEKALKVPVHMVNSLIIKNWTALYNAGSFTKRSLQTISKAFPLIDPKLSKAIGRLGFLAGINTLFVLASVPTNLKGLYKKIKLGDREGIFFSAMGNVMNLNDALDSFITFTGSLSKLGLIPSIAFFSTIGAPIAIVLLSYGTLKGSYDTIRYSMELYQMCRHINPNDVESIRAFLDGKLEVPKEEIDKVHEKYAHIEEEMERNSLIAKRIEILQARTISQLERHTDKKVVNIMKNLQEHLNNNREDLETAKRAVTDMKSLMKRRIAERSIKTIANGAMLTALVCSTIFPIAAPIVFPVVAGGRAALNVGIHVYNNTLFDKGLNLPEFVNTAVET